MQANDSLLDAIGQMQGKYPERQFLISFGPEERTDAGFNVRGNAALLTTAFANVLDNACKYSAGAVQVQLAEGHGQIHLTIYDQGRGIEAADMAHVLDPLYRGHNTEGVPGYGIGLAVTQKIITLHAGTLEIVSNPGHGTTVVIRLPEIG